MDHSASGQQLAFERLLFFSDAVFAIAITLLVIEIKVPPLPRDATDRQLALALLSLLPAIIGFLISFFLIGQTWTEHHRIGRLLVGFDLGLLWWNLFLLFFVAFMPFATAVLSEHIGSSLAVTVYVLCLAGLGLAKAGWWRHAVRRNLVAKGNAEVSRIGMRVWATPLTALAIALAALVGVPCAYVGFMFIPLVAYALQRLGGAA